ncbi:major facilitator transporter [Actibacterium mucosum KCTC 23349]|uniref:Major facilitator transporter n=1 Tax=Actibacterium mucosum KCTC 23349 TaxID=1454373 RepID=A0A037ZKT5_9RHOB|nr:MFS transporter [Actibacterium mucosum]KAJ56167.1 major facilitator transporter [Actibacterium mucosum KCTC 23349]
MLNLLRHPVFARLFAAQVVALLGTGLLSVALGLLAFDLAGADAGTVLGTVYAIKMVAYVGLAPLATAALANLPRKAVLVGADLIRAVVAVALPFVTEIWQIYVLIFVLQAASATFTPVFQATIPDILKDERRYTRALSLSRLAYDLESLLSPAMAALLLGLMSYSNLFLGTVMGFALSTLLVARAAIPAAQSQHQPFWTRVTKGTRIYLATPRLRGLLALTLVAAAGSAFVIVNTVVIVRGAFGGGEVALGVAMASYGAGSMVVALGLPPLLDRVGDRTVMLVGGMVMVGLLAVLAGAIGVTSWLALLVLWVLLGMAYSSLVTPAGRLLRRSAHSGDRAAVFAAHFALSHLCWLFTYPMAGWIGGRISLSAALLALAVLSAIGVVLALRLWRPDSRAPIAHAHDDLPPDHPHLAGGQGPHAHPVVIDALHPNWPHRP